MILDILQEKSDIDVSQICKIDTENKLEENLKVSNDTIGEVNGTDIVEGVGDDGGIGEEEGGEEGRKKTGVLCIHKIEDEKDITNIVKEKQEGTSYDGKKNDVKGVKESEESNTNASVNVSENKEKMLKSAIVSIPKIDESEKVCDNTDIDIDKHKGKRVSFDIPEENVEHVVCSGDGNGKGDDVNVSSNVVQLKVTQLLIAWIKLKLQRVLVLQRQCHLMMIHQILLMLQILT